MNECDFCNFSSDQLRRCAHMLASSCHTCSPLLIGRTTRHRNVTANTAAGLLAYVPTTRNWLVCHLQTSPEIGVETTKIIAPQAAIAIMTAITAGIFRNTCRYRSSRSFQRLTAKIFNAGVIAEMPDLKTLCVERQMHSLTHRGQQFLQGKGCNQLSFKQFLG